MEIRRDDRSLSTNNALKWITFCLTQLEKAQKFSGKLDWGTEIVKACTLEEIIGALVIAEIYIKELERELEND
jgi:hypothetical protein